MIYEKNKVYSFDRNDFSVSKETGRTFFLLNDDNSDYTMRIVPFKFQTVNTPDSLKCRYLGNGRWEQVKRDLVPGFMRREEYMNLRFCIRCAIFRVLA